MRYVYTLVLFLAASSAAFAQSSFTRKNPPGPHSVGFQVVEQYDFSHGYRGKADLDTGKPITGQRARPIQTLIWYPAEKGASRNLQVVDYFKLRATTDNFEMSPAERAAAEAKQIQGRIGQLSPDRAKAELAAPMLARRDAVASAGKFPVVIYAPSFSAEAFENADLCEYLASHGYVVISSPSLGQSSRDMTTDLEGIQAQVGDIQFLIGYAHSLKQVDTSRIAVAGFSWGGLANSLAAAKDTRIGALVTLDGSARSWPDIIKQSRYLTPARATAPMLYLAATPKDVEDTAADVNMDTSFLAKMKYADLYRVTFAPYVHSNFAVMFGQRLLAESQYGNYDKDELSVANAWVETYVRRFLDAYMKGDASSRAFLDTPAAKTGAPAHLFTVNVSHSKGAPPNRAGFASELASKGFDNAVAIYKALQAAEPDFSISESELNNWGYRLLGGEDTRGAVAILKVAATAFKDSWNAHDSLAEAYAANGDKDLAIAAYRESVRLNPKNTSGLEQLKRLEAKP